MSETTLKPTFSQRIQGVAVAAVMLSSASMISVSHIDNMLTCLPNNNIISSSSASKSEVSIGEKIALEETRINHIKSLRGKYKNNLTHSEEFMKNKADEISLEG